MQHTADSRQDVLSWCESGFLCHRQRQFTTVPISLKGNVLLKLGILCRCKASDMSVHLCSRGQAAAAGRLLRGMRRCGPAAQRALLACELAWGAGTHSGVPSPAKHSVLPMLPYPTLPFIPLSSRVQCASSKNAGQR